MLQQPVVLIGNIDFRWILYGHTYLRLEFIPFIPDVAFYEFLRKLNTKGVKS